MFQLWFSLRVTLLLYETFQTGSEDHLLTYSIIVYIKISIHSVAIESCGNIPLITPDSLNEQNIDESFLQVFIPYSNLGLLMLNS